MANRHPLYGISILLFAFSIHAQDFKALKLDEINQMGKTFRRDVTVTARQNALAEHGIKDLAIDRSTRIRQSYLFSDKIDVAGISNQKSSGRCWLFAGLNILRPVVMDRYDLEEFEFSQNYLFFYDKLEKSNLFINQIISWRDRDVEDRYVQWLLDKPIGDGGQWNMVVDLVEKYGLVPMSAMPETHASSNTSDMNMLLQKKLRQTAARIFRASHDGASIDQLHEIRKEVLGDIYRLLSLVLGEPPQTFTWQYENKKGKLSKAKEYTPFTFRDEVVKKDLGDFVYLLHNPIKQYYQPYSITLDRDMVENPDMSVVNIPLDVLKSQTLKAVLDDEPVWFACDVGQEHLGSDGLLVKGIYDYEQLLGIDVSMSKGDQILYRESVPTHAMVFVGVDRGKGAVNRWMVENSWGEERGKDGYWLMDDAWFDKYLYGVILPRKYLDGKTMDALSKKPIILPPWDPMYDLMTGPQ